MLVPRRVYANLPLDIMNSPSKCGKTLCVFLLHGEFDGEMRHHEPACFGHKMCHKLAVPTACRSCIIVCENAGHGEKPCQLPSYLNCLLVCNEKKIRSCSAMFLFSFDKAFGTPNRAIQFGFLSWVLNLWSSVVSKKGCSQVGVSKTFQHISAIIFPEDSHLD